MSHLLPLEWWGEITHLVKLQRVIYYKNIGYWEKKHQCQDEIGVPKLMTTEMLVLAHQDKNGKYCIEH